MVGKTEVLPLKLEEKKELPSALHSGKDCESLKPEFESRESAEKAQESDESLECCRPMEEKAWEFKEPRLEEKTASTEQKAAKTHKNSKEAVPEPFKKPPAFSWNTQKESGNILPEGSGKALRKQSFCQKSRQCRKPPQGKGPGRA